MNKPFEIDRLERTLTVENDEVLFLGIMSLPQNWSFAVIMEGERVGVAQKTVYSPEKIELNYYPNEPVNNVTVTGKIEL